MLVFTSLLRWRQEKCAFSTNACDITGASETKLNDQNSFLCQMNWLKFLKTLYSWWDNRFKYGIIIIPHLFFLLKKLQLWQQNNIYFDFISSRNKIVLKPKTHPTYHSSRIGMAQRCNIGFYCKDEDRQVVTTHLSNRGFRYYLE